jgi:mono/diheme cytochrome c family protein
MHSPALRFLAIPALALSVLGPSLVSLAAPPAKTQAPTSVYVSGDLVRLARKETLQYNHEPFLAAPKGQEFTVLKHESAKQIVYLAFVQKEGAVIAVTLPEDSLELVTPDGWMLLIRGCQAFRDQRFEDAGKLIGRSAQDAGYKAMASQLAPRLEGMLAAARQVAQVEGDAALKASPEGYATKSAVVQKLFADSVETGREIAADFLRKGFPSLAIAIDEGIDRLSARVCPKKEGIASAAEIPQTKLAKQEVAAKAMQAAFSVVRCRQAMAVRRMVEAKGYIEEGLQAEPARPELKAMHAKVVAEIADAEDRYNAALSNQKRNLPQALLALERGLKTCADLPQLVKLREELSGALEEKTAPPVTPVFLSAAKTSTPTAALEEGRKLYMTRCTQCHDLEMLDSRTASAWKSEVSSMARRAKIDDAQQNTIVQYLAAAHVVVTQGPAKN